MARPRSLLVSVCAANVATCLAFAVPAFVRLPVFWYYPLARRWAFELQPGGLAMDWYGRSLLAVGIGAAAFAVAFVLLQRRAPSGRAVALWIWWSTTATVFAGALYAYQLVHREPTPEPLPTWYVPR